MERCEKAQFAALDLERWKDLENRKGGVERLKVEGETWRSGEKLAKGADGRKPGGVQPVEHLPLPVRAERLSVRGRVREADGLAGDLPVVADRREQLVVVRPSRSHELVERGLPDGRGAQADLAGAGRGPVAHLHAPPHRRALRLDPLRRRLPQRLERPVARVDDGPEPLAVMVAHALSGAVVVEREDQLAPL
ncbi:MAG: hypothetical protein IT380_18440 [Myxococcales bacterium]|nr:hypothetical protein [Myxococcales bacterium]